MTYQARRELLLRVAPRYREASRGDKSIMLQEFVAVTGYSRKYAIRLLASPTPPTLVIKRPRERRYGPQAREALRVAWVAANRVCAKRLVPFLPELTRSLERHGHLRIDDDTRRELLGMSPATADRILRKWRAAGSRHGLGGTRRGKLLKHQVPVRTFAEWSDVQPGFMEADRVGHGGTMVEGSFVQSCVKTDVATGWTECLALLHRSGANVVQAIDRVRELLPLPLLGVDTDNGSEFLNEPLIDYCAREAITFTRGRAYRKNDQCYVEQKNGSIVRNLVGYDRFEGQAAYGQLTELYRAVRLYVNFFQPSMKLRQKRRDGSHVWRSYDSAQTPFQRLCTFSVPDHDRRRLQSMFESLDPVRLLHQIRRLQDALWQHAVLDRADGSGSNVRRRQFEPERCGVIESVMDPADVIRDALEEPGVVGHRKYRRSTKPAVPRTWRTRVDPFADVWDEAREVLSGDPDKTAKQLLADLQQKWPDRFSDGQLRTLQRRVRVTDRAIENTGSGSMENSRPGSMENSWLGSMENSRRARTP